MSLRTYTSSCGVLIAGIALWLSIAAFNNLTDPNTNQALLSHTLSMDLIIANPTLGMGLSWRALPANLVSILLYIIIFIQFSVAIMLWRTVYNYYLASKSGSRKSLNKARSIAIVALTAFEILWLVFMNGGLWLGYWLNQGEAQNVHMKLVIIGLLLLLYVTQDTSKFKGYEEIE